MRITTKPKMKSIVSALAFALLALSSSLTQASPLGTSFTYQGRLEQNGQPAADGVYTMRFALYDSQAPAGNPVSGTNLLAVTVTNGLFTTDLDFGAAAFAGEARWLETAVSTNNGVTFTTLLPRTRVAPTPNAIYASTAGTLPSGTVVKSLNGLQDTVTLTPGANISLTPSGNNIQISASGTIGSLALPFAGTASSPAALFQVNNTGASATSEGVVGMTASTVSQVAAVRGTATGTSGAVIGVSGVATNSPDGTGIVGVGGITGGYFTATRPGGRAAWFDGNVRFNAGNVGIGGWDPDPTSSRLQLYGQDGLRLVGFEPFLTLYDSNHGYNRSRIHAVDGAINLETESFVNGSNPFAFLKLHNNGNVGLGNFDSSVNTSKLQIYAQDGLRIVGYQPFLNLIDDNAGYARGRIQSVNGTLTFETEGFINGTKPYAYAALDGQGNFAVATLTIRGGADLAEPFPMKEETVEKGAVVVIDKDHPGQLKRSTLAYDKRVAGIVSGANGINPGIALKQEGALDHGENVALTGRVYVQADAGNGAIEPGDLLTTSDTPGHAMKVTDHTRAQGAILGKAMGALNEGKGLVLVLVTLQ
jgi:hypothetical protein